MTAAFVMAALGAFYLLAGTSDEFGRTFVRVGVIAGVDRRVAAGVPHGRRPGPDGRPHQPVTLAAMEGLFQTEMARRSPSSASPTSKSSDSTIRSRCRDALSFLTYARLERGGQGLDAFPRDHWPDNIPLLYFSYHIMVGLGTIFIGDHGARALSLLWRGRLYRRAACSGC